jgi:hypothetical protein
MEEGFKQALRHCCCSHNKIFQKTMAHVWGPTKSEKKIRRCDEAVNKKERQVMQASKMKMATLQGSRCITSHEILKDVARRFAQHETTSVRYQMEDSTKSGCASLTW